ncbi:MAG: helix-turn-helix domain-containing protein, partial [Candidatus Sungbacteria bacterium]|nr:helix-turn-helix domain-containing protein [Candidatus Sungbacteria bacterium]
MEHRLISLREAAKHSGVDQNYLRVLINRNVLRAKKIGRDWFVTEDNLDDYLRNHARNGKRTSRQLSETDKLPPADQSNRLLVSQRRKKSILGEPYSHNKKENLLYFLNDKNDKKLDLGQQKRYDKHNFFSKIRYVSFKKHALLVVFIAAIGTLFFWGQSGGFLNLGRQLVRTTYYPIRSQIYTSDPALAAASNFWNKLLGAQKVLFRNLGNDIYHFDDIFNNLAVRFEDDNVIKTIEFLNELGGKLAQQPPPSLISGLFSSFQPLFSRLFIGTGLRETVVPATGDIEIFVERQEAKPEVAKGLPVITQQVKQIVERVETFVPGDLSRLRFELTNSFQIEANKLRAELAVLQGSLTTTSRIADSSLHIVTLSQRIDNLNDLTITNGLTVSSGSITVSNGGITANSATFQNLTVTGSCTGCSSGGGSQTPWTSEISGGGFNLVNAGSLTFTNFAATSTSATSTISTGGLAIGTSQFIVQQTSGNIGVGTTSPSQLFSVAGSGYFTTGLGVGAATTSDGNLLVSNYAQINGTASTSNLTVSLLNAANCDVKASVTGVFSCGTDATGGGGLNPPLYLSSAARFGIGTSTPGALFSITATSSTLADRTILYGLDNFVFASSSTSTIPIAVNAFSFATSTTVVPLFSLDTLNSRIGILNTAPGATLSVNGTASTSLLTVSGLGNTATRCLNLTNQGVVGVAATDCISAITNDTNVTGSISASTLTLGW